ncbi:RagB/SusD family nutrient uptake outer membrane protein [uncultured Draconibacterium sp.]|uniref:RagB/SusD family nutrient uptake outer membrane protein n=1 Tax=uncultured Draconibacterium sp. TaxID=1573823 RepID=UPI0029C76D11|nr:RagB/SusD family nutrient uptake outer membrane protein [uncultured Draconibacterium sp.]
MKKKNSIQRYISGSIVLVLLLLGIYSCNEDVLDETPLDFISTTNAFNSPGDIEMGVVGLYSFGRDWYSAVNEKYMFVFTALGTDLAYFGEDPAGGYMSNWDTDITPTSDLPKRFWTKAFDLVYQSNTVIAGIENLEWNNEDKKNMYLAEARFFRAFSYRILVTLYGDVPLVTEPIATPKTDFVRAPKADIYKLMEEDFAFAAEKLPLNGQEATAGRLTQGAAWHMLSETYLAQNKYQLAVDAATHVINDYDYDLMRERFGSQPNLFGSENVYYDLFTKENHNLGSNKEAIWVVQNDPDVTGGGFYAGERGYGCAYYRMGNTPDGYKAFLGDIYNGSYTGYSDTLGRPVGWSRPSNYTAYSIWESDWNNDYRNAEACIKRHFYFDNPNSAYDGMEIDWSLYESRSSAFKDTNQYIFPFFMKAASPNDHYTDLSRAGGGVNHKDVYAIRLAETYLLRAEAYLGLSESGLSADDINEIRERSNATPVEANDVTIDYILDERARELYTEEWRMLTLMRLGKLVERVRTYNNNPGNPGLSIQDYQNLWPIPQTEIDLNTGAVLEQNPGYE